MHLRCVLIYGNTVQITDFILWVVPKHLSSKSFVHTLFFLLVYLSPHLTLHFFFLAKFLPSLTEIRWDFPGSPVVKNPPFHCRGHRFDPW